MKVILIGTLPPIIGLSPYCLHLSNALSRKVNLEFLGFKEFSHKSESFIRESKIDETYYMNILKQIKTQNILNWYNPFSGMSKREGDLVVLSFCLPQAEFKKNSEMIKVQITILDAFMPSSPFHDEAMIRCFPTFIIFKMCAKRRRPFISTEIHAYCTYLWIRFVVFEIK